MADIHIREATPEDADGIARVLGAAFPGPEEMHLVEALRGDGDISLLLVALDGPHVAGCVVFSPLETPDASEARLHALAPLAVLPQRQRSGIGARLVRASLEKLRSADATGVVVLGDPAYYGRFGFSADLAATLESRWSGPYLQGLMFSGERPSGALRHARAFDDI